MQNVRFLTVLLLLVMGVFQGILFVHGGDLGGVPLLPVVLLRSIGLTTLWMTIATLCVQHRYGRILFTVFFGVYLLFWIINAGFLYFGHVLLQPLILYHVPSVWKITPFVWQAVAFSFLAAVLTLSYEWLRHLHPKKPRLFAICMLCITLLTFGGTKKAEIAEWTIAKSVYMRWGEQSIERTLSPSLQEKLTQYGLYYNTSAHCVVCDDDQIEPSTPLLPNSLHSPNVIVFFLEGFSTFFAGPYNDDFTEGTPELVDIAAHPNTTLIHEYFSAGFPSMPGYFAQLCSVLFPSGQSELRNGMFVQHKFTCLPNILSKNGYESHFVTGVDASFTHKDLILPAMGAKLTALDDLKIALQEEPNGWGYSDHQLISYLQSKLTTLSAPFFLVATTLDTHAPWKGHTDGPDRFEDDVLLKSYHSTDHAIGEFWDWFQQSPLHDNTIVVFASDQTIPPMKMLQQRFGKESKARERFDFYDENLLMYYIPNSILDKAHRIRSSHIDFAPTLLHLLGIPAPPTFEGHSLFGNRSKYPNILGLSEHRLYSNAEDTEVFSSPYQKNICNETDSITACDLQDYYWWKRAMLNTERLWKK